MKLLMRLGVRLYRIAVMPHFVMDAYGPITDVTPKLVGVPFLLPVPYTAPAPGSRFAA